MDVSNEIIFKTTRSGGSGGQNVNKVETAVIAFFPIDTSAWLSTDQKAIIKEKLSSRITAGGLLQVKSQTYRTQLENKKDAIVKINGLLIKALQKKKPRIATKATRASVERRIEVKKRAGQVKESRRKYRGND